MDGLKYRRVLLKLSGEALQGERGAGIDFRVLEGLAGEIETVTKSGVQLAIVIGAGNFWRGQEAEKSGMERATADYAGMLATLINCVSLQSVLEKRGLEVRVQSAIEVKELAEPYIYRKAISHLEKGRIVIFAGGTGNPFFTTDTAAALRAVEIRADALLKATKVDGVYDRDPVRFPEATRYDRISYTDVLVKNLKVMDATAIAICRENGIPVIVFNLFSQGAVSKIVKGKRIGTLVEGD